MPYIAVFFIFYFSIQNIFAAERFICNKENNSNVDFIINFYVIEKNLMMSGASGDGSYNIINKSNMGILATNSSLIGKEFGLETVLIDLNKKTFIYKSLISATNRNNLMEIKGTCIINY